MKKQIPNLITLCNLLCGVLSICETSWGNLFYAGLFILLGIFFDFFDGLFARLLNVASPMGKELDSLADVITSGVAPGFILFQILGWIHSDLPYIEYIAFLIPAFAAYRLAKFNLDERQHHGAFLGLPAPANALIWCGLFQLDFWSSCAASPWITGVLAILFALLMVSEIPMFSFKFKNMKWADNKVRFIFLAIAIVILAIFWKQGLSAVVVCYIILSLLTKGQF